MAKKVYVLKTSGISINGFSRDELKEGRSIELDSEIGDKYAKRGFVIEAKATVNEGDSKLKKEVAALKKKLKAAEKKIAELEAK